MTDIKTLRDALQELVDRDCRVFDRTLEITFESHQQAMRALRAAREAYQAVDAAWPTAEPDCWAILTPNGSRLVPPDEAKGRRDAYPLYRAESIPAAEHAAWRPIETAPKSRHVGDGQIEGVYLLGYCPEPDASNLESCVCVVWWEPLMKQGRGMWYGEGGYETHPTHWMPLPALPVFPETQR